VSHDRYFVDKLATKIIQVGGGEATLYPGTYEEFHWKQTHDAGTLPEDVAQPKARRPDAQPQARARARARERSAPDQAARRAAGGDTRRATRAAEARRRRIEELETRIAEREQAIRDLEASMAAPGFYDDHASARAVADRHQALMWEVGDLMNEWEALQNAEHEPTEL
jgi:ATP-binding cassette subfamily F protein 3